MTGWKYGTLHVAMAADEYEEARARARRQIAYVDAQGFRHVGRRRGDDRGGDQRAEQHIYGQLAELAVAKVLGLELRDPAGSHRGLPDVGPWEIKASVPPRDGFGPRDTFNFWGPERPPHPVLFVRTSPKAGCILRGWLPPERLSTYRIVETSGHQVLREIPADDLFELSPEILRDPKT